MIEKRVSSLAFVLTISFVAALVVGCGSGADADAAMGDAAAGEEGGTAATADMQPSGLPNPFTATRDWGDEPPGRGWGRVSGVGVDPAGELIWVAERCGYDVCIGTDVPVVLQYTPDGTLVKSFGGDMFMRPHGMHVDSEGNVWVTDVRSPRAEELEEHPGEAAKGHQVVKFTPEGEIVMILGTPGEAGDPADGMLTEPNDVITTPNGDIYVSEGHSGSGGVGRVSRFSADGTFIATFGEPGDGPGQFSTPHALALDSQNRLFVADRGNSRVQIFDLEGNFLDEWHQFGRPSDVHVSEDDEIFTVDYESGDDRNPGYRRGVYIGDASTGELTAFIPAHEVEDQPLGMAGEGVVKAADGSLYVGEVVLQGMTKYEPR